MAKKNMNNRKYWKDRDKAKLKQGIADCNKLNKELEKEYKKAEKEIQKEIAQLYQKFAKDNSLTLQEAKKLLNSNEFSVWRADLETYMKMAKDDPDVMLELNTLAMKSRISRLDELQYQTNKILNNLHTGVKDKITDLLVNTVKDNYSKDCFNISKDIGLATSFAFIDQKSVLDILNHPWSGKHFSKTLWDNTTKLKNLIKTELTQMIIRGESNKKVADRISACMGKNKNAALRVVRTEHANAMAQASKRVYNDLNLEQYEYLATLDKRTCKDCGALDGKVFKVADAVTGLNYPPMHPNDRCTTVPYYKEDEFGSDDTRIARDENGKNIKVPANMSFNEWKKMYVDKNWVNDSTILNEVNKELDKINKEKQKKLIAEQKAAEEAKKQAEQKAKEAEEKAKKLEEENKKLKAATKPKKAKEKKKKLPTFKKDEAYKKWYLSDFNKMQKEWNDSVTKEEIEALVNYSGEEWYKLINKSLRGGKFTPKEQQKLDKIQDKIEVISNALQRNKTTKDMKLYRGTSHSMFKDVLSEELLQKMKTRKATVDELKAELMGTIIKEKALCSTTTNFAVANNFYENVIVSIDVNRGSTGLANIAKWSEFQLESEVLMDKGTQFYIKDIEFDEDRKIYYINVHYLGQE